MKSHSTVWIAPTRVKKTTIRWLLVGFMVLAAGGSVFVASLVLLPPAARFTLTPDRLAVHTKEGFWQSTKSFPLHGLVESKLVRVSRGTRLAGTTLPGFCRGWFSYPEVGKVWQMTDCGQEVVFLAFAPGERVLLAPQDPQSFLAVLASRQGGSFALRGEPGVRRSAHWWLPVLLLLPIVLCLAVTALVLKGPERLAYALEPGALVVRTFARTKRFDLRGATAQVWEPGRLARVAGSNFPGYYVGLFWHQGKPLWVYASHGQRGILVEGKKRVFITPENEQAFLAMLREVGVATQ